MTKEQAKKEIKNLLDLVVEDWDVDALFALITHPCPKGDLQEIMKELENEMGRKPEEVH